MNARPSRTNLIHIGIMAAVLVAALLVVALTASPLGSRLTSSTQSGSTRTDQSAKAPEREVTLTGTLGTQTAADGATEYTLTNGGTVLNLDAGPAWFFPNAYPLAPYVGQQVTIVGEQREGSTSVDDLSVNGTALREPGKPPWAGGWKVVASAGDTVAEGDTLVILESMKMEIPVIAESDGTVRQLAVNEGDVVQEGDLIAVID